MKSDKFIEVTRRGIGVIIFGLFVILCSVMSLEKSRNERDLLREKERLEREENKNLQIEKTLRIMITQRVEERGIYVKNYTFPDSIFPDNTDNVSLSLAMKRKNLSSATAHLLQ